MRRAALLASVLGLVACIITPKDLEARKPDAPNLDLLPLVYERRAFVQRCGKGPLEKREKCIQDLELEQRKRTNR